MLCYIVVGLLFLDRHEVTGVSSPVCQKIDDVFRTLCSPGENISDVSSRLTRGPQGKRGPQGMKGDVGRPGGPAVVDYERIDTNIAEKLDEAVEEKLTRLVSRIVELETIIETSRERIQILEKREGICEVKYDGKCFWVVAYDEFIPGYDKAVQWCAENGGTPANIYSREHHSIIMRYLRSKIFSGRTYIHLWLGMRTDPTTGTPTFSDGRRAPYVKWYPGTPGKARDQTHMTIVQRVPASDKNTGIHNWAPTATREGVLCEM